MKRTSLFAVLCLLFSLSGCVTAVMAHHEKYRIPCKRLVEKHLAAPAVEGSNEIPVAPASTDWENVHVDKTDEYDYFRGEVEYENQNGATVRTYFICQMPKDDRSAGKRRSVRVAFSNEPFPPYGAILATKNPLPEWKD